MTKARIDKILLVDDDRQLQENLCTFFSSNGFDTVSLFSGRGVLEAISKEKPCAVLLDVMLPDGADGFEIIRHIRSRFDLPVLMLTARGKEIDMVVGLESGADDYLAKPFRMLELLARIRAVLRRMGRDKPDAVKEPDVLEVDGFVLNPGAHTLCQGERSVELSATEIKVLRALMENPGDVLQRDVLLSLAFGQDYHSTNRNVDVHVSHLRARLRELSPGPSPIRTVWGSGYRWRLNE
jgi:two-component system phosphate regulon response regulator OmpR